MVEIDVRGGPRRSRGVPGIGSGRKSQENRPENLQPGSLFSSMLAGACEDEHAMTKATSDRTAARLRTHKANSRARDTHGQHVPRKTPEDPRHTWSDGQEQTDTRQEARTAEGRGTGTGTSRASRRGPDQRKPPNQPARASHPDRSHATHKDQGPKRKLHGETTASCKRGARRGTAARKRDVWTARFSRSHPTPRQST